MRKKRAIAGAGPGSGARAELAGRASVAVALLVLLADELYKRVAGVGPESKEACAFYREGPPVLFRLYENFLELFFLVLVGLFVAALLEAYAGRLGRFLPRNPLLAFLYGSILPACSCGAIPLAEAFKGRVPERSLVAFLVAAPLLNPYIVVLSFGLAGARYAALRIGASFVLSLGTGFAVEALGRASAAVRKGAVAEARDAGAGSGGAPGGCAGACAGAALAGIGRRTLGRFARLLPWLFLAGALSLALDLAGPLARFRLEALAGRGAAGVAIAVLLGAPIYLCNGADVALLAPLLARGSVSMGTAIAFSLASTAVCASSVVMLGRFLGTRKAAAIALSVTGLTFLLGLTIDAAGL